jgi:predicted DNA-binding protein (MmcQ/YjbR family)
MKRECLLKYAKEKYRTNPEFLWKEYPENCVLRHNDNRNMNKSKWITILLDESVSEKKVCQFLENSYEITSEKTKHLKK